MHWVAVALGGALGALARYGISTWVFAISSHKFPYATLAVNVLGSFLMGILLYNPIPPAIMFSIGVD